MANVSAQGASFLALSEAPEHVEAVHLETVAPLSLEVRLPPLVEELCLDLLVHVVADEVLVLIVFVHEVHGVSVPLPEGSSPSLNVIVLLDFDQFADALLELDHVFGAVFDLLNGVLGTHIESLSEDLEEKFGSQEPYMRFVLTDDGCALSVHRGHVVFIPTVELIHFPDEVVALVSE